MTDLCLLIIKIILLNFINKHNIFFRSEWYNYPLCYILALTIIKWEHTYLLIITYNIFIVLFIIEYRFVIWVCSVFGDVNIILISSYQETYKMGKIIIVVMENLKVRDWYLLG